MNPSLGPILLAFFEDHLKVQKGLRLGSIRSYRDTLRLFLKFVSERTKHRISKLALVELTSDQVLQFLTYIEDERHNHRRTRNQRLAALHCFFEYAAIQAPEMLHEAARVAAIPVKRVAPSETFYLERDEVQAVLGAVGTDGKKAQRDGALLLFLYNTGARVQEVADLRCADLDLQDPFRVRLHGKGDKWRACPLWPETASLLKALVSGRTPDQPVFVSLHQQPLTRFGIYKIVRRRTSQLPPKQVNGKARYISPHVFRHATAVSLLESGAEPNLIRGWLGHVGLGTTNRYTEITIRMKEAALRACEPPTTSSSSLAHPRHPVWRDDETLLNWLQSL
jgi:site-specific recombinase XerD